jgi:hypothetical protein
MPIGRLEWSLYLYLAAAVAELARFVITAVLSIPNRGKEVMTMVTLLGSIFVTIATLQAQPQPYVPAS